MADDLRTRLIAALDRPDREGLGMLRRNPAEDAIPLALPHLGQARAIAEDLARHHASTRVRVHALQLWPRLCIFDPAAGEGTFRPGLGDDRLVGFRAGALELLRDPSAEVRAAAAIQLLALAEQSRLPELRAAIVAAGADRDLRDHDRQWGADDAARRLAGAPGATATLRAALATKPVLLDADVRAAIDSLVDAPDPAATGPLETLWAQLPRLDPQARLAKTTLVAWVRCAPPEARDRFPALLVQAPPAIAAPILGELAHHGDDGADALARVATATSLPPAARTMALAGLATAARLTDAGAARARAVAATVAHDAAVAEGARRLAIELSTLPAAPPEEPT